MKNFKSVMFSDSDGYIVTQFDEIFIENMDGRSKASIKVVQVAWHVVVW